jgi:hypothetical protein
LGRSCLHVNCSLADCGPANPCTFCSPRTNARASVRRGVHRVIAVDAAFCFCHTMRRGRGRGRESISRAHLGMCSGFGGCCLNARAAASVLYPARASPWPYPSPPQLSPLHIFVLSRGMSSLVFTQALWVTAQVTRPMCLRRLFPSRVIVRRPLPRSSTLVALSPFHGSPCVYLPAVPEPFSFSNRFFPDSRRPRRPWVILLPPASLYSNPSHELPSAVTPSDT